MASTEDTQADSPQSKLLKGSQWLLKRLLFWYVVVAILLTLFQDQLLYHPDPGPVIDRLPEVIEPYSLSTDEDLHGWVIRPQKPHAVIYFGGNGEAAGYTLDRFQQLLPDHAVYLLDYRGYGKSTGKPDEQGFYRDALALYDRIAPDHESISVIGRSLGSGVATHLAANRKLERLALVTPYDSVLNLASERYFLFPVFLMLKDRFESWRNVEALQLPTLVLLAENDHTVPHQSSQGLIEAFPQTPQVITVPGSNHFSIDMQALREFLQPDPLSGLDSLQTGT